MPTLPKWSKDMKKEIRSNNTSRWSKPKLTGIKYGSIREAQTTTSHLFSRKTVRELKMETMKEARSYMWTSILCRTSFPDLTNLSSSKEKSCVWVRKIETWCLVAYTSKPGSWSGTTKRTHGDSSPHSLCYSMTRSSIIKLILTQMPRVSWGLLRLSMWEILTAIRLNWIQLHLKFTTC